MKTETFERYMGMSYEQAALEAERLIEQRGWHNSLEELNFLKQHMRETRHQSPAATVDPVPPQPVQAPPPMRYDIATDSMSIPVTQEYYDELARSHETLRIKNLLVGRILASDADKVRAIRWCIQQNFPVTSPTLT